MADESSLGRPALRARFCDQERDLARAKSSLGKKYRIDVEPPGRRGGAGNRGPGLRGCRPAPTWERACEGFWRVGFTPAGGGSRHDVLHDFTVDIGEAEVASLELEGELFVVDAKEVQDGGLEVMDVDLVVLGVEADVVLPSPSERTLASADKLDVDHVVGKGEEGRKVVEAVVGGQ